MRSKDWIDLNAENFCVSVADGTHDSPKKRKWISTDNIKTFEKQ